MRVAVLASLLAAILVASTVACAGEPAPTSAAPTATPTPVPTVLRAPSLQPGEQVPSPAADPVLTLTGKIQNGNGGDKGMRLDPRILDQLGQVQVTVYEPWIKQDLTFQGVWLDELLTLAQPAPSATSLHLTALDDYQVDLPLSEVMAGGVLLATKTADGAAISVEDGGPTRIVYVSGGLQGASNELWIWSLSTIDIR